MSFTNILGQLKFVVYEIKQFPASIHAVHGSVTPGTFLLYWCLQSVLSRSNISYKISSWRTKCTNMMSTSIDFLILDSIPLSFIFTSICRTFVCKTLALPLLSYYTPWPWPKWANMCWRWNKGSLKITTSLYLVSFNACLLKSISCVHHSFRTQYWSISILSSLFIYPVMYYLP